MVNTPLLTGFSCIYMYIYFGRYMHFNSISILVFIQNMAHQIFNSMNFQLPKGRSNVAWESKKISTNSRLFSSYLWFDSRSLLTHSYVIFLIFLSPWNHHHIKYRRKMKFITYSSYKKKAKFIRRKKLCNL